MDVCVWRSHFTMLIELVRTVWVFVFVFAIQSNSIPSHHFENVPFNPIPIIRIRPLLSTRTPPRRVLRHSHTIRQRLGVARTLPTRI